MRTSYSKIIECDDGLGRLACCDIQMCGANTAWLARINVPEPIRRLGVGRMLMEELLYDADVEKVNIVLTVNAYGRPGVDLDTAGLEAWYARLGFKDHSGLWIRDPAVAGIQYDYSIGQSVRRSPDRIRVSAIRERVSLDS